MWGFLAFIIIVSIALGISLHDAFWGIIAFCAGGIALLIICALCGYGIFAGAARIKQYNTPQAKALRKAKRKKAIKDNLVDAGVLLWIMAPFGLGVLFACLSSTIDPYDQPLKTIVASLTIIAPILFIIASVLFLIMCADSTPGKKHTTKK